MCVCVIRLIFLDVGATCVSDKQCLSGICHQYACKDDCTHRTTLIWSCSFVCFLSLCALIFFFGSEDATKKDDWDSWAQGVFFKKFWWYGGNTVVSFLIFDVLIVVIIYLFFLVIVVLLLRIRAVEHQWLRFFDET